MSVRSLYRLAAAALIVGATLAFVGTVLLMSFNYVFASVVPVLTEVAPEFLESFPGGEWPRLLVVNMAARATFALGFVLLAIATYRAAILPRSAAVVTALGAIGATVVFLLPRPLGLALVLLLPAGLSGLGWGLWSSTSEAPGVLRGGAEPDR